MCVIWCFCFFSRYLQQMYLCLSEAAENCLSFRGSWCCSICASFGAAKKFLLFACYLQLTFLCLISFWCVFTFFIVILKIHFVICVWNLFFLLFLEICISPLCAFCVAAENFLLLRGTCRYSISASCVAAESFLFFAWYFQLT
jgi:hypothetical protein